MTPIDVRPFVDWVLDELEPAVRVDTSAGAYARQIGASEVELYGTTDMACIVHTVGHLDPSPSERTEWCEAILSFRDPATGEIREREPTHDVLHNTAFAVAALELLDYHVAQAPAFLEPYSDPAAGAAMLAGLDWTGSVWLSSHQGAGLGSLYALVPGLAPPGWFDAYFAELDRRVDPASGMLGDGRPAGGDIDQIGGTFHYLFLYEWAHRSMPHPQARIDAVLGLQQPDGRWLELSPFWLTLDAVYILTRGVRDTAHRRTDVDAAVGSAAKAVASEVLDETVRSDRFGGELGVHEVTAALSVLAEAQAHLGTDVIVTERPLSLVLDRRPFI